MKFTDTRFDALPNATIHEPRLCFAWVIAIGIASLGAIRLAIAYGEYVRAGGTWPWT